MRYRAVVISHDVSAVRLLTRVLKDLRVDAEHCPDVDEALERLSRTQYDAVIVDTDENNQTSMVLETAKAFPSCKRTLAIVLARSHTKVAPSMAHIVLYKPISVERVVHGLRAIRNLMARERRTGSQRIPVEVAAAVRSERIGTAEVILADLSEGGAAVRCERPLPTDGLLTITCQLPDTSSLVTATAEVVWQDSKGQFGIRFVDIASASRGTLSEWLKGKARSSRHVGRARGASF